MALDTAQHTSTHNTQHTSTQWKSHSDTGTQAKDATEAKLRPRGRPAALMGGQGLKVCHAPLRHQGYIFKLNVSLNPSFPTPVSSSTLTLTLLHQTI